MSSSEPGERGKDRRRGITGLESQSGSGAARRMLLADKGEGWAWRRRCESAFQVGRGAVLIWEIVGV